jgi:hypothetical protein
MATPSVMTLVSVPGTIASACESALVPITLLKAMVPSATTFEIPKI